MKKYSFLVIYALLSVTSVCSQEITIDKEETIIPDEKTNNEQDPKSSVFFDGSAYNFIFQWNVKSKKSRHNILSHWTGLGFAFANLEGLEDVDLKLSRSYSVVLNLMDCSVPLNRHWLFASGLGFDWNRYHFKGNYHLQDDESGVTRFIQDREGREYKDSKLLVYYMTIPLVLEYQTKIAGKKRTFIYGGLEGLVKCYSKSQAEIKTQGEIHRVENKDLNIRPLNARCVLRMGFNDLSIFGYYQLFSLFEKEKGPQFNPYGIGFMINFR